MVDERGPAGGTVSGSRGYAMMMSSMARTPTLTLPGGRRGRGIL